MPHGEVAQALADGQFVIHLQPVVDLRTGYMFGFEALVRWVHHEASTPRIAVDRGSPSPTASVASASRAQRRPLGWGARRAGAWG
jgi:predicted signal transduction protein with EAL and GGDEF domain